DEGGAARAAGVDVGLDRLAFGRVARAEDDAGAARLDEGADAAEADAFAAAGDDDDLVSVSGAHGYLRWRKRSRATAMTMMAPVPISWTQWGQPIWEQPDWRTCMIRAPISEPRTEPSPPARLPPPMTTAAMTLSSRPVAPVGSPTVRRENCIRPARP